MAVGYQEAAQRVGIWVAAEGDYAFTKNDPLFSGDAELPGRLTYIMNIEIPNKWGRFQLFRRNEAPLQASQQILKVCAAARAASMLNKMIDGVDFKRASRATFEEYENQTIEEARSYNQAQEAAKLDGIFALAIGAEDPFLFGNRYTVVPQVFRNASRMAIAQVMDVAEDDRLIMPEPGHPSGNVVEWQFSH